MLTISCVASSSAGNMYILEKDDSRLVLELGITWNKALAALRYDLSGVAGCLVTHQHLDHSAAMAGAAAAGLDVYASDGTLQAKGLSGHRFIAAEAGKLLVVGPWVVLPFDVVHDAPEPLGYVIKHGTDKILFITDSEYSPYKFADITHLIIEANFSTEILKRRTNSGEISRARVDRLLKNHFSIERVIDLLQANQWSNLVSIHLIHLSDENSDEKMFLDLVRKTSGVPVFVAKKFSI